METFVRLFQAESKEVLDADGNLKMDDYRLVLAFNTSGYFPSAVTYIKEGNLIRACQELHHFFNHIASFERIKDVFVYKGRPIDTGDVIQIEHQGEITFLYCRGTTFTIIHPVNVPPVLDAETLLENHQFLVGLELLAYEDEELEPGFAFLRFSNDEVSISASTLQYCEQFLNKKIVRLRLCQHFVLGEWVIAASFEGRMTELYVLTGVPLCIDLDF